MVNKLPFTIMMIGILVSSNAFTSPAEDPEETPGVDKAHKYVGSRINYLANQLDSFFATERADDELGRSSLRIRYLYFMRERAIGYDQTRYRINLRLPHLEEKFKYQYYADQGKSDEQLQSEKDARQAERRNRVKTGWLFNADAQVSLAIPPRLTTRARLRRTFETDIFLHRFTEELIYVTDETGLTEETSLQSDKRLTDTLLFRFINSKQWRILKKDFVTTHGPTFPHQITDDNAVAYSFVMTNVIEEGVFFTNAYTLSINYRRNLYKNWVYLDVVPGVDFPKQWSFRRTPFINLQLEILVK